MSPGPYSLPSSTDLAPKDDWTQISDPKEKKRVQNRVAQRTYRHRVKSRIGALQARLNYHEGRTESGPELDSAMIDSMDTGQGVSHMIDPKLDAPPLVRSPQQNPAGAAAPVGSDGGDPSRPYPSSKLDASAMSMRSPGFYGQAMAVDDNGSFSPTSQMMRFPGGSLPYQQPLSRPPFQFPTTPPVDRRTTLSEDLMYNVLRVQSQLLERLSSMEEESNGIADRSAHMDPMTHSMDMNFNTIPELPWGFPQGIPKAPPPHPLAPPAQQMQKHDHQQRQDQQQQEQQPHPNHRLALSSSDAATWPTPSATASTSTSISQAMSAEPEFGAQANPKRLPTRNSPMHERFEAVMERVMALGFDSFDEMVTGYYSESFREATPLANEQRLSRTRRLPRVLQDLHRAADHWSDRERRALHEEILRASEAMLVDESSGARSSLVASVNAMVESTVSSGNHGHQQQQSVSSIDGGGSLLDMSFPALKTMVQNELPHLFALNNAVTAINSDLRPRCRSNTVVATNLLLLCAGNVPTEQLLRLLETCLTS